MSAGYRGCDPPAPRARASEWVPVDADETALAGRLSAAITEFEPIAWTPAAVLELALVRGLIQLAQEYKVTL